MRIATKVVTPFLATCGLLLLIVTLTPLVAWWASLLAGPWSEPKGEVLIVLGGAAEDDGTLAEGSLRRSLYAFLAYQRGGFRDIILTGGPVEHPVADSMKAYLEFRGVPASVIHVERLSTSTRENAAQLQEMLKAFTGRKVLLTSDYHMTRAHRVFARQGLDVEAMPIPDALKRATSIGKRWSVFLDLVQETLTLSYYVARGWA